MERRKTSLLILGVCAFVLSVIGVTYAFWQLRLSQKDNNTIGSSCFDVELINEKDAIQLEKAYPILDEEASSLKPYKFTIKNHCDANASYQINLEALSQYGSTTIAPNIRLKPEYIRAQLNEVEVIEEELETEIEKDIVNLDSTIQVSPTLNDTQTKSYDAFKLATGYLGPQESKSFALRIWLDGDLTMEDEDAMNKTFASKITVTTSYLSEFQMKPQVDLELALCENNILVKGMASPFGDRNIQTYEFKLDEQGWETSENLTKSYSVEPGSHTVSLKVTDSVGEVSEVKKTIEAKNYEEPETAVLGGQTISLVKEGNGLYKVSHCDVTGTLDDIGFSQEEYRYSGVNYFDHDIYTFHSTSYDSDSGVYNSLEECKSHNQWSIDNGYGNCEVFMHKNSDTGEYVHNYVKFNCEDDGTCETWRIIGLVNVKTKNGIIKRLKLIKNETIEEELPWDSDRENDWTKASLMTYLNSGEYYTEELKEQAKGMIAEDIIWNIGGWSTPIVTTTYMYGYERGTNTGKNNTIPSIWPEEGDSDTKARVGLMYPSDYGYAVGGTNRDVCIKNTNFTDYGLCYTNWLFSDFNEWLLTPESSDFTAAHYKYSSGYVSTYRVYLSLGLRPVVYLKSDVQIKDNGKDGSYENPFELELVE